MYFTNVYENEFSTPLLSNGIIDEGSIPDVSQKTHHNAVQLFEENFQKKSEKTNWWQKAYNVSLIPTPLLGISGLGLAIYGMVQVNSSYTFVGLGSIILTIPLNFIVYLINNKVKKNHDKLNKLQVIKCFAIEFQNFKDDPTFIKIISIFDHYSKIVESFIGLNYHDFAYSKIILMEEVSKILVSHDSSSELTKKWEQTKLQVNQKQQTCKDAEPWKSLGIDQPDFAAYERFDKEYTQFTPPIIEAMLEYSLLI
jgi:hypothetical protein